MAKSVRIDALRETIFAPSTRMSINPVAASKSVALQRTDQFVGRTMNWLYDHLRVLPRYTPVVLCDLLANRHEFPLLEAWSLNHQRLTHRLWRRIAGDRLPPSDYRRLRRLAPCVLHSHFGYVAVDDSSLLTILHIPWVVSFYGADVYQLGRQAQWQERYARIFDRAARVLALGPVMAAHLEKLGCPREKVTIHPLGIDVETLPSKPRILLPGQPLKILFAGTFREKKGIRYVIQAVDLARQAGVPIELDLVGDEGGKPGDRETKNELFGEIRSLALEKIVTHHPFLSFHELIGLALQSHVFVGPSVTAEDGDAEGTPFVLQQMMATAMPAVATRHSDIPYLFGEHGHLLVAERDGPAIAKRLQYYFDNPQALASDGMMLRDRLRRDFDLRKCATRLSDIYDVVRDN